ncbi:MAG TPA: hypothetical protein VF657_16615 [Actinoplanes sp.]
MRILFDGVVPVDYGQIYVTSRELPEMSEAFAGQVNGLCGAGEPGALFLMTGTRCGRVRFEVELHDRAPSAAADEWEEVVEAPFVPRAAVVDLVPWGEGPLARLPLRPDGQDTGRLPGYRVRYHAAGMDEGRDRYLLCFWPESGEAAGTGPAGGVVRADAIVRQTSRSAAYWHGWAAGLPAPPTLWEQVESEKLKRLEHERRDEEHRRRDELRRWGGRAPSARLRTVAGNVHGIVLLDRDLVDGVTEAGDATQRRIAVWAARQAFTVAGIADLEWMAPAWAALERGGPLPAEFTDMTALLVRILREQPVTYSVASLRPRGGDPAEEFGAVLDGPVDPVAMALPALAAAVGSDPLQAALEALWAAVTAYADRRAVLLAEVRRAFPMVDRKGPH